MPGPKRPPKCPCAAEFSVRLLRSGDYREFKRLIDRGDHPTFIGRETYERNADNGGALLYSWGGAPVAASMVNPHLGSLLLLNVLPAHRGHGLGGALLEFLQPNFVRALESAAPWFCARGYRPVGEPKQGRRFRTVVLVRGRLLELVGRLSRAWGGERS